jgi:hypothetical protein
VIRGQRSENRCQMTSTHSLRPCACVLREPRAFSSLHATARHNLATSLLVHCPNPTPSPHNSSTPSCARGLASKRALHPIHNVKQPKNKVDDPQIFDPCSQFFFFLERPEPRRKTGGAERDRTDDLLLAKQALSQLSYGPIMGLSCASVPSSRSQSWWAREDLNFRPHAYQARALTN